MTEKITTSSVQTSGQPLTKQTEQEISVTAPVITKPVSVTTEETKISKATKRTTTATEVHTGYENTTSERTEALPLYEGTQAVTEKYREGTGESAGTEAAVSSVSQEKDMTEETDDTAYSAETTESITGAEEAASSISVTDMEDATEPVETGQAETEPVETEQAETEPVGTEQRRRRTMQLFDVTGCRARIVRPEGALAVWARQRQQRYSRESSKRKRLPTIFPACLLKSVTS